MTCENDRVRVRAGNKLPFHRVAGVPAFQSLPSDYAVCLMGRDRGAGIDRCQFGVELESFEDSRLHRFLRMGGRSYHLTTPLFSARPSRNCFDFAITEPAHPGVCFFTSFKMEGAGTSRRRLYINPEFGLVCAAWAGTAIQHIFTIPPAPPPAAIIVFNRPGPQTTKRRPSEHSQASTSCCCRS